MNFKKIVEFDSISNSRKFDYLVTAITLGSVVLAVIMYLPQIEISARQLNSIYIFDLGVVVLLAFDFYLRMRKYQGGKLKFVLRHWYEIPAMFPLLLFTMVEQYAFAGAAIQSLRLLRLFRLIRLVRLANLFRSISYLKMSGIVYLIIITVVSVIFGSIGIYAAESGKEDASIKTYDDAVWFAFTTMTISGYGDVYPTTMEGRVISTVLILVGLAIILGFISNLGAVLVESKMKGRLTLAEETRLMIKEKIDNLEKLEKEDIDTLLNMIKNLHETLKNNKQKNLKGKFNTDAA